MPELDLMKNWLLFGVAIFAPISAWFAMKYGQRENTNKLKDQDERIKALAEQVKAQWQKSDQISVGTQKVETTIKWLKADAARIDNVVEYMRRKDS